MSWSRLPRSRCAPICSPRPTCGEHDHPVLTLKQASHEIVTQLPHVREFIHREVALVIHRFRSHSPEGRLAPPLPQGSHMPRTLPTSRPGSLSGHIRDDSRALDRRLDCGRAPTSHGTISVQRPPLRWSCFLRRVPGAGSCLALYSKAFDEVGVVQPAPGAVTHGPAERPPGPAESPDS